MAAFWLVVASSAQQNAPGACLSMFGIMREAYSRGGLETSGVTKAAAPATLGNAFLCSNPAVSWNGLMQILKSNLIVALRRLPLFNELSEQALEVIAERVRRRKYEANEMIFSEGEACQGRCSSQRLTGENN